MTLKSILRPFLLALLACWALVGPSLAASVVTYTIEVDPKEAPRGGDVTVKLVATVNSRYHIYGMKQPPAPPDTPGPVNTEIIFADENTLKLEPVGEWVQPPNKLVFDEGFERDINKIYGSPLTFTGKFRVPVGATPGSYDLKGYFVYMACTETNCLPAAEDEFTIALKVSDAPPALPPIVKPDTKAVSDAASPAAFVSLDQQLQKQSFFRFLLTSFLLGIAALFTPCVFPMIPITISFFTNKGAKSRGEAIKYASIYVVSIIGGFTLVGFGISMLLLFFGGGVEQSGFANQFAANPWVNLFFAALYLVFALSLFEVIHLQLPSGIANKFNRMGAGKSEATGIAFKALVFVIISFTCTAPIVGIAIVDALQGSWFRPLFSMLAFSAGFASPFFLLALVPQWLGSLPKAGGWLYATKVVMGLAVIAFAFKFLSNADLVLFTKDMILSREILLAVWAGIAFVATLYLLGLIKLADEGGEPGIGIGRLLFGTTAGVLTLYLTAGLFGTKLHIAIESYLPPDTGAEVASSGKGAASPLPASRTATGGTEVSAGFSWFEDTEPAFVQAKKLGKPVFIDFTGWSCTNCRLMEKNMFPRPEITPLLEQFVRVKLYTDDRTVGKKWIAYQTKLLGSVSLPSYAVVTPDGKVLAKAEYTTDVSRFTEFLSAGLAKEIAAAH